MEAGELHIRQSGKLDHLAASLASPRTDSIRFLSSIAQSQKVANAATGSRGVR